MKFGDRLKERREKRGFTQDQLGKLLNVSDATINRYERNLREPDYETLKSLANLFNCTTDYLLGLTDNPTPESIKPDNDGDVFASTLAANMEQEYGKPPSPEFLTFAKNLRKQLLDEVQKKKN